MSGRLLPNEAAMNILGIETSCDETAAAVVSRADGVRSNEVYSQIARHQPYGGVVPEIASRCHVEALPGLVRAALEKAGVRWDGVSALAVTRGPGLVSSLLIGVTAARALALRLGRPLLGVHHVEAHLYSVFLGADAPTVEAACPLLALMVSGGHTALIRMERLGAYQLLGQTLDDAAGEALDKGAKLLGLGYPGGPAIERAAAGGDPEAMRFPRGLEQSGGAAADGLDRRLCFSFSGLKTALLYYLRDHPEARAGAGLRDVAASYQEAVFDALVSRAERALREYPVASFACVGGVARNARLRDKLTRLAAGAGKRLLLAHPDFCTDNAAMVAGLALARLERGLADSTEQWDVTPTLPLA